MRLLWVSPRAEHRSGASVVVVVGAHFRTELASLEDILLYSIKVYELSFRLQSMLALTVHLWSLRSANWRMQVCPSVLPAAFDCIQSHPKP